ncbi:hypothetical protein Hanom_Chr12g01134371 [Helianthus anomalus]
MPISNPYHPSHYGGYTRDELLLSLQLQFEILSPQVQELEFDEGARRSPFPFHPTSAPPPSLLVHASVVSGMVVNCKSEVHRLIDVTRSDNHPIGLPPDRTATPDRAATRLDNTY